MSKRWKKWLAFPHHKRPATQDRATGFPIPDDKQVDILKSGSQQDNPRYSACISLWKSGIPSVVWLEDALAAVGIPTAVCDLFLLVSNPSTATQALLHEGYINVEPSPVYKNIAQLFTAPRLCNKEVASTGIPSLRISAEQRDAMGVGVVLLSSFAWHYEVPDKCSDLRSFYPKTAPLLDSLMNTYMDLDDDDYNMCVHIGVLIGYFYLSLEAVREPGFDNSLQIEHRQMHYDMLTEDGIKAALSSFPAHQYHRNIRDKIRRREHFPVMANKPIHAVLDPEL